MPVNLKPIENDEVSASGDGAYALITKEQVEALANAMPDAQSAVLALLAWQSARQERMEFGPLAGKRIARISASAIAVSSGRPLRTIRHALATLKEKGLIELVNGLPGRTAEYRVIGIAEAVAE